MAVDRQVGPVVDTAETLSGTLAAVTKRTVGALPSNSTWVIEATAIVYSSTPANNVQYVRKVCIAKNVAGTVTVYQGTEGAIRQGGATVQLSFVANGTSVDVKVQDSVEGDTNTHAIRLITKAYRFTPA